MISVREVIVVEGRYDKNTLAQLVDTVIIETNGFGVFKDREKLALMRRLAEARGLIIFTDSDAAGFMIRNHLKGAIDPTLIKHAYIPQIEGRERRKSAPSKEGTLGVEGMKPAVILAALRRAGATIDDESDVPQCEISRMDLYNAGLSGTKNSAEKRRALLKRLELPERLSSGAMLDVLNALYSHEEFLELSAEL